MRGRDSVNDNVLKQILSADTKASLEISNTSQIARVYILTFFIAIINNKIDYLLGGKKLYILLTNKYINY